MAKNTKKKKKNSKHSIITAIVCISIILSFIAVIVVKQVSLEKNKAVLSERQQVLAEQKAENEGIKEDIANGNNLSFIEKWARALGYAFPHERVHVDSTPDGNN